MPAAITQSAISRLRSGDYLADGQLPGLRVVAYDRSRAFVYRYRDLTTGKLKQVTIGDAGSLPIADARDQVRALQRARKAGADPRRVFEAPIDATAANEAQTAYTVRALVNDYCRTVLAPTKRGSERERMLRNDLKSWFLREASAVRASEVRELVAVIAARAPDIAGRVLRELRAAYRLALQQERIPDGVDPTYGVKAPKESQYVPRDRAFTAGEWRTFVRWLPKSGMSGHVRDALMLTSLTACRPGEATAAVWRDIDLKAGSWTIRKRKRDGAHVVFLSTAARALLRSRLSDSEHVFPSPSKPGRPIREHALVWSVVNAREECPLAHWTPNDLRRSAATLLQSQGVRFEVVRRILGHYSTRNPTDIYARQGFDAEARAAWNKVGLTLSKWAPK